MARFCTLYSGSSGNSTYIGTGTGGILVDAGVSCKALLTALSARDIRPDTIRGLFLTHEHIDHIKGVPDVVVIASGRQKATAISYALKASLINTLITDGTTASAILGLNPKNQV